MIAPLLAFWTTSYRRLFQPEHTYEATNCKRYTRIAAMLLEIKTGSMQRIYLALLIWWTHKAERFLHDFLEFKQQKYFYYWDILSISYGKDSINDDCHFKGFILIFVPCYPNHKSFTFFYSLLNKMCPELYMSPINLFQYYLHGLYH